jgi:ferric-dicitrate binding protein FerR (iron transport regulator)
MKLEVTRNVVKDLWPLCRAGEASPDSKALVDAFLAEDTAYASILEKSEALGPVVPRVDLSPDAERRLLDEAQRNARLKLQIIGASIAAAAFLLFAGLCAAVWLAVFRLGAG